MKRRLLIEKYIAKNFFPFNVKNKWEAIHGGELKVQYVEENKCIINI